MLNMCRHIVKLLWIISCIIHCPISPSVPRLHGRLMSLTPTAVPELQLDCRLLRLWGRWWRWLDGCWLQITGCMNITLRAKQTVPGSPWSALQHDWMLNLHSSIHAFTSIHVTSYVSRGLPFSVFQLIVLVLFFNVQVLCTVLWTQFFEKQGPLKMKYNIYYLNSWYQYLYQRPHQSSIGQALMRIQLMTEEGLIQWTGQEHWTSQASGLHLHPNRGVHTVYHKKTQMNQSKVIDILRYLHSQQSIPWTWTGKEVKQNTLKVEF